MPSVTLFIHKCMIFFRLFQVISGQIHWVLTLCRIMGQILIPKGSRTKSLPLENSQTVSPCLSTAQGVSAPHPCVVQRSTILETSQNLNVERIARRVNEQRNYFLHLSLFLCSASFSPFLPLVPSSLSLHQSYFQSAFLHCFHMTHHSFHQMVPSASKHLHETLPGPASLSIN